MLQSSGENVHSCLDPDFKETVFNLLMLIVIWVVDMSYTTFITFRYIPTIFESFFLLWKDVDFLCNQWAT